MRTNICILFAAAAIVFGCTESVQQPSLLPLPSEVKVQRSEFTLQNGYGIACKGEGLEFISDYLSCMVEDITGLKSSENGTVAVKLELRPDASMPEEGYSLRVARGGITIAAGRPEGIFYGVQTLRQLLPLGPACAEHGSCGSGDSACRHSSAQRPDSPASCRIPCVNIEDSPRFGWRGLHLDVSRHFFTVDQVKRFIDVMAMYKFNRFHWHLTDDQGWRIEIKSHPELTSKGAWREGAGFPENDKLAYQEGRDARPYGGFYTQDQIREVVSYAADRMIEVVPEIDLPGHSTAAIHALPQLYCFPSRKLPVRMIGGVSEGVMCAGKESTFLILEDVLDEVCALFPSEYIHLGGDEAPKDGWKRCTACQARIKAEGLENEQQLQAYFMKRLEKIVNGQGKHMIGWDEIMEGGLSESVTVMSWRGVLPGLEAARGGNDVIMTPGSFVYLNHPQSRNRVTNVEGGFLTLKTVYSFDPAPLSDLSAEEASHIKGVEACQWSEGTPNEQILYYKEYPRAIAVAEMGWTAQESRVWPDFYNRLNRHLALLDHYGIHYGEPSRELQISVAPGDDGAPQVSILAETDEPIHYTLDGTEPTLASPVYTGPIEIGKVSVAASGSSSHCGDCRSKSATPGELTVRAQIFALCPPCPAEETIRFHKALCKKVSYTLPYSSNHNGGGDFAMTDGRLDKWQGFEKQDADFTIDLGSVQQINSITSRWKYDISDWVLRPREVVYGISSDGVSFDEVYRQSFVNPEGQYGKGVEVASVVFGGECSDSCGKCSSDNSGRSARYIRVKAASEMLNPAWHGSAGAACWIFVDEVVVE